MIDREISTKIVIYHTGWKLYHKGAEGWTNSPIDAKGFSFSTAELEIEEMSKYPEEYEIKRGTLQIYFVEIHSTFKHKKHFSQ